MRTRTSSEQLEAESVWGIEVMDPPEQIEWAQTLWQKLDAPISIRRPLLLVYSPPAERTTIRSLNALSRIARRRGIQPYFAVPRLFPLLNIDPKNAPTLRAIHRASRFVNLAQWLKHLQPVETRIVVTCAADECAALAQHGDFEIVNVPEEETSYCERMAGEIVGKRFPPLPEDARATQSSLEHLLAEAGMAGIPVPLSLLARHLRIDCGEVTRRLQAARLRDFVEIVEDPAVVGATVVFRGRWLAEKIAQNTKPGFYSRLTAMLPNSDSRLPVERYFFLALLIAYRAQGTDSEIPRLLSAFYHHFHKATSMAEPAEREAWRCFHREGVLPLLRH